MEQLGSGPIFSLLLSDYTYKPSHIFIWYEEVVTKAIADFISYMKNQNEI